MSLTGNIERKKYFNPVGGKWAMKVREGTEGAVKRTLTKGANIGTDVYEICTDYVQGTINSIHSQNGDYGPELLIEIISDDGESGVISIPLKKRLGMLLLNYIPMLNMASIVRIIITKFKGKDGKERNWLFMNYLDGNKWIKCEMKFPKDEGLPDIEEVRISDTEVGFNVDNRLRVLKDAAMPNIMDVNKMAGEHYFEISDDLPSEQTPPSDHSDDFLKSDPIEGTTPKKKGFLD